MGLDFVAIDVETANADSVPISQADYRRCLQAAMAEKNTHPECKSFETIWDRGLADPIAYYTLWLTFFTLALATVGVVQGIISGQQIKLARDEFNITHRPKMIVRNFQLGVRNLTDLSKGEAVNPIFIAQNIGDSSATIIEGRSTTFTLKTGEKLPSDLIFPVQRILQCGARQRRT